MTNRKTVRKWIDWAASRPEGVTIRDLYEQFPSLTVGAASSRIRNRLKFSSRHSHGRLHYFMTPKDAERFLELDPVFRIVQHDDGSAHLILNKTSIRLTKHMVNRMLRELTQGRSF